LRILKPKLKSDIPVTSPTDVDMPGSMDGLKLAHYVRGRWPPVKIIVTSGHVKVTEESLPAGALFMPKPYDSAVITHKIRELMAA
jgi:FixJ family two-component response regulator